MPVTNRVAKSDRVCPTAETLAKLRQPPWRDWGTNDQISEYARAASEIDAAYRLICAGLFAGAADLLRSGGYCHDWSPRQRLLVGRYRQWLVKVGHRPGRLALVIDAIVHLQLGATSRLEVREALDLYLSLHPLGLGRRDAPE
jgi:hypothetical protein